MDFLHFWFLISNGNRCLLISNCGVSLVSESKGFRKQIIIPPVLTKVSIEIFSRFFTEIIELLNMGTINSKNYICVRHHVKNIYNLEIDQAMELNIKL